MKTKKEKVSKGRLNAMAEAGKEAGFLKREDFARTSAPVPVEEHPFFKPVPTEAVGLPAGGDYLDLSGMKFERRPGFSLYQIDSSAARRELEIAAGIVGPVMPARPTESSQLQTILLAEIERLKKEKRELERVVRNYLRVAERERMQTCNRSLAEVLYPENARNTAACQAAKGRCRGSWGEVAASLLMV